MHGGLNPIATHPSLSIVRSRHPASLELISYRILPGSAHTPRIGLHAQRNACDNEREREATGPSSTHRRCRRRVRDTRNSECVSRYNGTMRPYSYMNSAVARAPNLDSRHDPVRRTLDCLGASNHRSMFVLPLMLSGRPCNRHHVVRQELARLG